MMAFLLVGCGAKRAISGQIVDRNGHPLERVVVRVDPGEVEIVTDTEGGFVIDYLRNPQGARQDLSKKTDYRLEAFKPGYHITQTRVPYRRGSLTIEAITLVEETIRVSENQDDIDPEQYDNRTHSAGTNYEGE